MTHRTPETREVRSAGRFRQTAFGIVSGGLLLAGCARQAVVGSPGTPGGDASEATLRSNLADLHEAEQRFNETNGRYTNQLGDLEFSPAPGIEVSIVQGDRRGYSAIAAAGDSECAVFGGEARPPRSYVAQPGLVGCRP
jgi:hypothetical protein